MKKITSIKERIIQYAEYKGFVKETFYKEIGVSSSNFKGKHRESEIGGSVLTRIITKYPDLNPVWLLTDTGEMLLPNNKKSEDLKIEAIPVNYDPDDLYEVQKVGSTFFRNLGGGFVEIDTPLVPERAYAGYAASWSDSSDIDVNQFPRFKVTVKEPTLGEHMAFEVDGDSMNNGSLGSIPKGSIVTGRKLAKKYWTNKLHLHKYHNYILVTEDGVQVKEITEHRVEEGIVTCRSLNPDKARYPDFELRLSEVREIFYVKSVTIV